MKFNSSNDILLDAANVLHEESRALSMAAQRLQNNVEARMGYQQAVQLCCGALEAGGKIVVTGVGKSGKVGEKIVATMLSTGTYAVFLHPVEALHGDLGVVRPGDIVLALSYSGHTDELLLLLPSLKRLNVPIIGLGGNVHSKLAKACAAWLDGSVQQEAGGSDIPAPTTSTTLALAIGDALALSLAKLRQFSADAFAHNHPSGALGRRLLLNIEDAMVPASQVATVDTTALLCEAFSEMMSHPKGCCVIVLNTGAEEQSLAGVITHWDMSRALAASSGNDPFQHILAKDIMTPNPPICAPHDRASEIRRRMTEENTGPASLLPVVDKSGRWQGIITLRDLQELF